MLINGYGPTENTTFTCCYTITKQDVQSGAALPIGTPIKATQVYVLDADLLPVADGEAGELCVAGAGLALGYLNRPDLTDEKFIQAPWDKALHLYRTGDLVRMGADGLVQFYGRIDNQVKIRGFRVELGEIETALAKHPGVQQSVVEVRVPDGQSDKVVVAYYVPAEDTLPWRELDSYMRANLPDYARPAHYVALKALPLNHNGKVDRRHLPDPDVQSHSGDRMRPESVEETRLLGLWCEVLGSRNVTVEDDFFELGGHSLLAVRLFARIKDEFGVNLPISTLFQNPTVRNLAQLLDTQDTSAVFDPEGDWDPSTVIHPGPVGGGQPLFMVGGAGGNVNNLVEFGAIMGQHRPVIGLQTRGILGHSMHRTIEAMAKDNILHLRGHQPKGPYLLAGYSGGAITAFEMARQLEAMGEKVERLFILDTYAPRFSVDFRSPVGLRPGQWLRNEIELLRGRGLSYLWERIDARWHNAIVHKWFLRLFPDQPEIQRMHEVEQGWMEAAQSYRGGPYRGQTTVIFVEPQCLKERMVFDMDPMLGWADFLTEGKYTRTFMSGSHLGMVKGAQAETLVRHMEAHIHGKLQDLEG